MSLPRPIYKIAQVQDKRSSSSGGSKTVRTPLTYPSRNEQHRIHVLLRPGTMTSYPWVQGITGTTSLLVRGPTCHNVHVYYVGRESQIVELEYNCAQDPAATQLSPQSSTITGTYRAQQSSALAAVAFDNQIRVYYMNTQNIVSELIYDGAKWSDTDSTLSAKGFMVYTLSILYATATRNDGGACEIHVGFQPVRSPGCIQEAHYVDGEWHLLELV
ncbi:uncharacterized protein FIBRA_09136 [Fibroporia radiculosa]|uniref:Uncharacterized protein n=1 Tax=Fibroporia radiculosa TaxID=599839 RepID=J4GIZ3_9APHY|nr:uncharacterized protein FIBRA_09136 [Fibroporia radiculosa]CCM06833.1 predicted protein [Fibroporia radiculosa]